MSFVLGICVPLPNTISFVSKMPGPIFLRLTPPALRIAFQHLSVHRDTKSINNQGWKIQLRHELQNKAIFDYSGTLPGRNTDSSFM